MFAISFDLVVSDLRRCCGESYNSAYFKIKRSLNDDGFWWIQGSTYVTLSDDMLNLFKAIQHLNDFDWFRESVRDIRGFRMENASDFTPYFKE
ncbi:MAG: virulence protein [Bacteroidales bacterium]|nr:virulence protein [Candidatus Cacconaster equi]MCQ2157035.1 virulence protein [Bacteroidales bacterium]